MASSLLWCWYSTPISRASDAVRQFSSSQRGSTPFVRSKYLKLATAEHYRKRKNDADGIADRLESSAVQKMSLSDFVSGELGRYASGIAEMTYRSEPSWMFCGSIRPETDWELEGMCRELRRAHFPDYDCVTTISNPSEFARQLGIDVGSVNHASVKLNQLEYWKRQLLRLRRDPFRRVVFVHHGPVIYRDTPYSFIERFSENERGLVAQFVKRTKFAGQREYRFIVSIGGEPTDQALLLDVSDALRSLVKLEHGLCEFQ